MTKAKWANIIEFRRIFMSKALKDAVSLMNKKKKIEKKVRSLNVSQFVGLEVKLSKGAQKFYKSKLSDIFGTDDEGSTLKGNDKKAFEARKIMIKKNPKGKVIKARNDQEDGVVFIVKFDFPELEFTEEIILGLESVKAA